MKNTNIKIIQKIFFKILWSILGTIGVIAIYVFYHLLFDEKARCLDIGQIYDPEQKICRNDCLTWDEKIGCVAITERNIRKKEKELPFN